jgi:CO/xanthine dehydrogenase FAD-binding subunit
VKPVPFRYAAPRSVDEALGILREAGFGGKILAGGQSLVPMMNFRLARPDVIVDVNGIRELAGIAVEGDTLVIGAMTRHQAICDAPEVARVFPLLSRAAGHIGHWAIRTRGTIGGSLAHADPAAEWPAVLQAVDARVEVAGPTGRRLVGIPDLVAGPLAVNLEPDELIVAVRVPLPRAGTRYGFYELARRPGDFALVGAVARVEDGAAAWTWFGLGHRPETRRLPQVDGAGDVEAQLGRLLADVPVAGDLHAGEAWRRRVAATVAARALRDAEAS